MLADRGARSFDSCYRRNVGSAIRLMARVVWLDRIGAMDARRLSLFLVIVLIVPTAQVVNPQRDVNAEENVAVSFARLRRESGMPQLSRAEGSAFAHAACQTAEHGNRDKVWVEDASYAAVIYSSAKPESSDVVAQLASRVWPSNRRLVVGACSANTPAFPSGRDWVAIGVVGGTSERSVVQLLTGQPISDAHSE